MKMKMEAEEEIRDPLNHMAGFFAGVLFMMTMGMVAVAAMIRKH